MASSSRGSVLMMVIIFTMILSIVGLATIQFAGMQEIAARAEIDVSRANFLADCGLALGERWLQAFSLNVSTFVENDGVHSNTPFQLGPFAIKGGSYVVTVYPQSDNNVNISSPTASIIGNYVISSTGTVTSGIIGTMDTSRFKNETVRIWRKNYVNYLNGGWPLMGKKVDSSYVEGPTKRTVH